MRTIIPTTTTRRIARRLGAKLVLGGVAVWPCALAMGAGWLLAWAYKAGLPA